MLQTLADYGVDDVHLVIATLLHRRMTEAEIRRVVGERAFKQYWPDRLYNFDAENRAELAMLGKTDHGEEVWLSRRAVESDLLIYLNINLVPMDGGHKSVAVGLAPYQSLRHHHKRRDVARFAFVHGPDAIGAASLIGPHGQADSRVGQHFSDRDGGEHADVRRDARLPAQERGPLHRLGSHVVKGFQWTMKNMSNEMRRTVLHNYAAPYGMIGVWAGDTETVHQKALARVFQQYAVPVKGQADILIVGVPYICPYNVNSIMNPVLVQCTGLGYLFNMYRNKPLVREGGTMIICHPLRDEFHPEHHPSYIEFFHRCLAETTDAVELEKNFEREFARNPTYIHMYRYGNAYHGVHPFYMGLGRAGPTARRARDRRGMRRAGSSGAARMGSSGHARRGDRDGDVGPRSLRRDNLPTPAALVIADVE